MINTTTIPTLVTHSVRDFMAANKFKSVANEVRVNDNGYLFVTFIDEKNEATNIYFSKPATQTLTAKTPIVRGFFDDFLICEVKNADGETRIKLCKAGSTNRLSINDLF